MKRPENVSDFAIRAYEDLPMMIGVRSFLLRATQRYDREPGEEWDCHASERTRGRQATFTLASLGDQSAQEAFRSGALHVAFHALQPEHVELAAS